MYGTIFGKNSFFKNSKWKIYALVLTKCNLYFSINYLKGYTVLF